MTFDELYAENAKSLKNYVYKHVWNYEIREDVEQETWLLISEAWGEYDPSLPFLPWAKGFFKNARRKIVTQEVKQAKAKDNLKEYQSLERKKSLTFSKN